MLYASAAVLLIVGDPAAADLAALIREAPLVLAPELMLTEVANTLWKLQRAEPLVSLDPQQLLIDASDLVDRVEPDRLLQVEALALACHLDHPVYDCLYLAPGTQRSRHLAHRGSSPAAAGGAGAPLSAVTPPTPGAEAAVVPQPVRRRTSG